MLAIIAAGGCTSQIITVPPGEKLGEQASRPGIELNRQELLHPKEPLKSVTERPIAAASESLRPAMVSSTPPQTFGETDQGAHVTTALPDIQDIGSPQTGAAPLVPTPAEPHGITASNDGLSGAWPAVFILAIVAALLLGTHLIGRRSAPNSPDKPLAKLLHTRPWR